MKKELPKIFKGQQIKNFSNNRDYFYGEYRSKKNKVTVDELFKVNEIYKTSIKLTLKDKTVDKIIIGRTQNNLITSNNEIIPISEIVEIERN